MDTPEAHLPSLRIDKLDNSSVSGSGDANVTNIGRDQHNHYHAASKLGQPTLMFPERARSFVGREDDLRWLHEHLTTKTGTILALYGSGGIGKTALAAEALSRLIEQSLLPQYFPDGIFYYSFYDNPSENNPSLNIALEHLILTFGEEPRGEPLLVARRTMSRRQALLVFDRVEGLKDSQPLQTLGGKNTILLLSRRHSDALSAMYHHELELLSLDQSLTLLQKLAGPRANNKAAATRLIDSIKGYPLALQLIGGYLFSRQEEIADYLHWFESNGLTAIDFGEKLDQSVPYLLQHAYSVLTLQEQHLFLILGLLAPAPFPLDLVQGILAIPEHDLRQALGGLINVSLLRRPGQEYEVSHPLIHAFAKESLSRQDTRLTTPTRETITTWQERLLSTLAIHFAQDDPYEASTLTLWLPHVLPWLSKEAITRDQSLLVAQVLNKAGFDAFTQGRYSEAEPLWQRGLAICEQQLGPDHSHTATSLNNLGSLYYTQGRYSEAEPLYQRGLVICEQKFGTNHSHTASSLNNLAELCREQGKYNEAELLYQRALTICEQQLGADHPDTAISMGNLASLYRTQGRYSEAEPLYQRALAICEQQLGPDHPDTAISMSNLAELYREQGKYVEAEPLLCRALTICEQQLGPDHPDTAISMSNLAELYRAQGKYVEAEPLLCRGLAICEQQLGADHPHTATSLNNLAELYRAQGKHDEAEPLYQRSLAIYDLQLGADHPHIATSLNNLALLYQAQSRYSEAEPLYQRALAIYDLQLGADHPHTASSLNNLAALYRDQGKYDQAESLYQRALTIYEHQLGPDHPYTASSLNNLAALYRDQGKYNQAEPLLQRALAIREHQLGPDHPDTATSLNNLAGLYQDQGKFPEAEPLLQRAVNIYIQQLGINHPKTQQLMNNYQIVLAEIHKGGDINALLQSITQDNQAGDE